MICRPYARLVGSAFSFLLLALATLGLCSCGQNLYKTPEYNFAGRPTPPSLLQQRVLVSLTSGNGSTGGLQILDGLRDIRGNLQNTKSSFSIAGYSGAFPSTILNYPEQLRGIVYSDASPYAATLINYGTETVLGSAGTFSARSSSVASSSTGIRVYSAQEAAGQLQIQDNGNPSRLYSLNLPNVYKVAVNTADTIALAMVRNSDTLYRVVKLNNGQTNPPGAVDCQPLVLPVYCVVPVNGTYDRPYDAYFSTDGTSAYVLNCGVECGGGANGGAAVSIIPQAQLVNILIPTSATYPVVVTRTISVPGGVTTALSDGSSLYMAGEQQQSDGLFAGRLSILNLSTFAVSTPISISDGFHTKLLFADDNTLWIGSQSCSNGERAKLGQNYNCLTRFDLGTQVATIVPAITASAVTGQPSVPFPNQDNNLLYLGSLTGLCWVQSYHKVYTAYGGQVHAFNTSDGSEINNTNISVQGSALDVAYMDALTNTAN